MKKQKEEFKSAIDALQERVTNLEHAHDDLEQHNYFFSVIFNILSLKNSSFCGFEFCVYH